MATPSEILRYLRLPRRSEGAPRLNPRVYILGSREKRVTLLAQQIRALNLVYSLRRMSVDKRPAKIAVIGGGVAGTTAAAAAHLAGAEVIVLERKKRLMGLFHNSHRYLHPHLFDWPAPTAETTNALLPVMNWHAGRAENVIEQLEEAWQARFAKDIEVRYDVTLDETACHWDDEPPFLAWTEIVHPQLPRVPGSGTYDAVIVAVGFGIERDPPATDAACCDLVKSYWLNDALEQSDPDHPLKRVLVSGCGDGGIVDYLRLTLRSFTNEVAPGILSLLRNDRFRELREELRELERRLEVIPNDEAWSIEAARAYGRIHNPEIDEFIRIYRREDTDVALNARKTPTCFDRRANAFNRFMLSRMAPEYRTGIVKIEKQDAPPFYQVRFDSSPPQEFHQVVIRHGPSSAVVQIGDFGDRLIDDQRGADPSLQPVYGSFYWQRGSGRQPNPTHTASREKRRIGLPLRAKTFVGREQEFRLVEHALNTHQHVVVRGFPGIGKSAFAKEYAHRYQNEYSRIFWVSAKSDDLIRQGFRKVAAALGLSARPSTDDALISQEFRAWLTAERKQWLFVINDAADASLQERLDLPRTGHSLMTCRASSPHLGNTIELPMLEVEQSVELLLQLSSRERHKEPSTGLRHMVTKLAAQLEGLPRALVNVGPVTMKNVQSVLVAIEHLVGSPLSDPGSMEAPLAAVGANLQPSLDLLQPATRDLLRLCSFLDGRSIPREMLLQDAVEARVFGSREIVQGAIADATRFALLRVVDQTGAMHLSRMLQITERRSLSEEHHEWVARAIAVTKQAVNRVCDSAGESRVQYGVQLASAEELIERSENRRPQVVRDLLTVGARYHRDRGSYAAAADREKQLETLLRGDLVDLLQRRRAGVPTLRETLAETLVRRGVLETRLGNLNVAKAKYDAALEQASHRNHKLLRLKIRNMYGWLEYLKGSYEAAGEHYKAALRLLPEDPQSEIEGLSKAAALNNYGRLEYACGRLTEAKEQYDAAFALRRRFLARRHPQLAQTLNNIGLLAVACGNYEDAADHLGSAYRMSAYVSGRDHPESAAILNNLALLSIRRSDLVAAQAHLDQALNVMSRGSADRQRSMTAAQSLILLAEVELAHTHYREAKTLAEQALDIRISLNGPKHPYTAACRCSLGRALTYLEPHLAYAELDRALRFRLTALGKHHPHVAESYDALATYYEVVGDPKLAMKSLEMSLAVLAGDPLFQEHPVVVDRRRRLAALKKQVP